MKEVITVGDYLEQVARDNYLFTVKLIHDVKHVIPDLNTRLESVDKIRKSLLDSAIKEHIESYNR